MNFGRHLFLLSAVILCVVVALLYWDTSKTAYQNTNESLVFYCAAGTKAPVEEIVNQYREEYGVNVQVQYGGSGTLLSNLQIAREGDVYLAADESYIEIAREKELVAESLPVAVLTPVIAVAQGNPKNLQTLRDLLREDVAFALGNAEAASVGKITKKVMDGMGMWDRFAKQAKVFKPTVNDIANDVKIGAVDAGIVWDSIVNQYPELEAVHSAELASHRLRTTIAILRGSRQPTAALKFARYLTARDKGLQWFEKTGYVPVDGDVWEETPRVVLYSGGVNRLAIEDTIKAFEAREGVQVERVYNGCGILVGQMQTGDRPDAYFACDVSFSRQVTDLFLDFTNLSETKMVILTQKDNPHSIQTLGDLTKAGLKLGMANPEQSALGELSRRLLVDAGIYDAVMKNVRSQTPTADLLVNQTVTGSLDAAIVYEANTSKVREQLEVILIDHPKANAIQPFAVGKESKHKYLMERFFQALASNQSKERFESVGFDWYLNHNANEPTR